MTSEEFVKLSNHDWQLVSSRLQAKLNAIACELDALEKNSVSFDCSFMARSIREKFGLVLNGNYVKPEWVQLERKLDRAERLSSCLRFASLSERSYFIDKLYDSLSDFAFDFHVFGPFVAGEMYVR